ncbi:hypothetical protein [Immundisolibacter sp.]
MKAELDQLNIKTKETYLMNNKNVGKFLTCWNDDYLDDDYMDDTLGIGIKDCYLTKAGEEDTKYDYLEFKAVWLTKAECIILKNYLDSFIQLAETCEELERKQLNGTNN